MSSLKSRAACKSVTAAETLNNSEFSQAEVSNPAGIGNNSDKAFSKGWNKGWSKSGGPGPGR